MPKAISNENQPENGYPSLICGSVVQGNVSSNQPYCWSRDKGNFTKAIDGFDCVSPSMVTICYDTNSLDACRRTDCEAQRACSSKNSLFCITTAAPPYEVLVNPTYKGLVEAGEWIMTRNKLEDSYGVKVCSLDLGQPYQSCDETSNVFAYIECGDLFKPVYSCTWHKFSDGEETLKVVRNPLGEVCELTSLATQTITVCGPTVTETLTSVHNDSALVIGLSSGIGTTFFLLISTFCWVWKLRRTQIR